jgi:hypothetical protein
MLHITFPGGREGTCGVLRGGTVLFLVTLVFLALFYIAPLHQVVYATAPYWPIIPPVLRRAYELTGINFPFWAFMAIIFALLCLLGKVAARFLETLELEREIAATVNPLVNLRGLGGVQAFGLIFIPSVLILGLIRGEISQPVLLLGSLIFIALLVNLTGRVPLPLLPPVSTIPLVGVTSEAPPRFVVTDGDIHKRYTWKFTPHPYLPDASSVKFAVELDINGERYQKYRQEPRELDPLKWDKYVIAPLPEVEALAARLADLHLRRGYCTFNQAANVLAFAQQCIKYTPDIYPEGEVIEYPKYPIESLVEEAGDCEDHAILAAALLKRMGIDVALLFCPGHVALGVAGAEGLPGTYVEDPRTGIKYFYGETTAAGWEIGELPKDLVKYLVTGEFQILPIILVIE